MQELRSFICSRQIVNLTIVGANIVLFIALSFIGDTEELLFMIRHGANYTSAVLEGGEYYRLVTSMFLHFGAEHLVYNMLVLIFMGDVLEKVAGKMNYFLIYFIGGIAGNVMSLWSDWKVGKVTVSAGASGAIFAVVGALLWIMLRNKGRVEDYSGKRLLLMAGLSVAEGITTSGVDNWAHIGGMVAGFLLAIILYRKKHESSVSIE
ncbi:MAG: rhomboid family intramembrane serine protease [Lachnospiraceae bacterium]|jgi:rhomboid protease GluP|nr:rhomboid family intramembrane serine protease [Lachnospiraceae bacterium]RKJ48084.1 rhomboid family intramembrane serine protease [bacterium 1XD42-54]